MNQLIHYIKNSMSLFFVIYSVFTAKREVINEWMIISNTVNYFIIISYQYHSIINYSLKKNEILTQN